METIKRFWKFLKDPRWIWILLFLGAIALVLLYISEGQFPNLPLSSGIVAFISAVIGVLLTAFAISVQLKEQSKVEAENDKNVKIYEQKIRVYSEFTNEMWGMFDEGEVTDEKLKKLRQICFRKLVFYLDREQIQQIADSIQKIKKVTEEEEMDKVTKEAAGAITHILQASLDSDKEGKSGNFITLFNSFNKEENREEEPEQIVPIAAQTQQQDKPQRQFWHFNMWGDEQIAAFKEAEKEKENWVLNLIEYGEDWRTNSLKRVQPDDIILLFRRGGYGYIGAFKPVKSIILNNEEYEQGKYNESYLKKYDIYGAMEDGGTLSANLEVEPIAYNFKGIGYNIVRRRTIERMVNDWWNVKSLLNRFKGEWDNKEEETRRAEGKGKLDENIDVKVNEQFLSDLIEECKDL